MKRFELQPIDGRKSFNNKCTVEQEGNISRLISFTTEVATYDHKTNKVDVKGYFSPTTARHINAFLQFYGFDTYTKKELENYYLNK